MMDAAALLTWSKQPFTGEDELTAAMATPEYKSSGNEAYRQAVYAKLALTQDAALGSEKNTAGPREGGVYMRHESAAAEEQREMAHRAAAIAAADKGLDTLTAEQVAEHNKRQAAAFGPKPIVAGEVLAELRIGDRIL